MTWVVSVVFCFHKFTGLVFDRIFWSSNFTKPERLNYFSPMFRFYNPWKRQKTKGFFDFYRGYGNETLRQNGLRDTLVVACKFPKIFLFLKVSPVSGQCSILIPREYINETLASNRSRIKQSIENLPLHVCGTLSKPKLCKEERTTDSKSIH